MCRVRSYYVYILASHSRRLYVGVTSDLVRRLHEHRLERTGFTARYRVHRLVYFAEYSDPMNAIEREKEVKSWVRGKKIRLIERENPAWLDLSSGWLD